MLTKHDDLLKCRIDDSFNDAKIEITPQLIDNTLNICASDCLHFDSEVETVVSPKNSVVKAKMTKIIQLEKGTHQLYDMEGYTVAEKALNIDLALYQMEDY